MEIVQKRVWSGEYLNYENILTLTLQKKIWQEIRTLCYKLQQKLEDLQHFPLNPSILGL